MIERAGWEWAFYISGLLVLAWTVGWIMVVYDTPKEHPWICDTERDHIVSTLSGTVSTTKVSAFLVWFSRCYHFINSGVRHINRF